jgi:glycosyltransferase involved in cell wall biosynthesis
MIAPVHLRDPGEREPLAGEALGLSDRPVVACVSRLERMKHPEDVVMAIAKARERDPRLAGVVIGEGAMRAELEALCAELGVQRDVLLVGDRDQRWIASLLAQATVVVAPLAGLALVEAALSGTPIVAYDVEWHSELITHGHSGILVAYRDTDAMAAAICALVEDPGEAGRLAAAARRRALEVLAPEAAVAHERALADELLLARA